jgi:hypothetical protein
VRRRRKFDIVVYPKLKVNNVIDVWPEAKLIIVGQPQADFFEQGGGQGLLRAPLKEHPA